MLGPLIGTALGPFCAPHAPAVAMEETMAVKQTGTVIPGLCQINEKVLCRFIHIHTHAVQTVIVIPALC
jgi:hypothetical protein